MQYTKVRVAGIAHVDAPQRILSSEIENRLAPALRRMGISNGILKKLSGIESRQMFDPKFPPSEGATQAAQKAIATAGIDGSELGVIVNTSVCRDSAEPSTASIVHQVGKAHTEKFARSLGIDLRKIFRLYPNHGNIGPAGVPITLSKLVEAGQLKTGDRVALMGIGSGINCSMAEVVW